MIVFNQHFFSANGYEKLVCNNYQDEDVFLWINAENINSNSDVKILKLCSDALLNYFLFLKWEKWEILSYEMLYYLDHIEVAFYDFHEWQ